MVAIFCQWGLEQLLIAIIGWVSQLSGISSTGILDAPYRAFVIAGKCLLESVAVAVADT